MYRSYRVLLAGNVSQSFVMARSAKEASEIAAKAMHDGEQVTVEDPDGNPVTMERLAEIIRDGEGTAD